MKLYITVKVKCKPIKKTAVFKFSKKLVLVLPIILIVSDMLH